MENGLPEPAAKFVERLGVASEAEGLPRIAGRLMAYLILSPEPCSLEELTEKLQISHGSASTNTRLLESLGVIERVTRAGERRALYQLQENPYVRVLEGRVERMQRVLEIAREARGALSADHRAARQRLSEMERFYGVAIRSYEKMLLNLRRGVHTGRGR